MGRYESLKRAIPESEVRFSVRYHPEDIPVRGNVSAWSEEEDRKAENEVLARLDNGDIFAWFWVEVRAEWNGIEGRSSLGGCNYESREDFESSETLEELKAEAYEELIGEIERLYLALKKLGEVA